MANESGQSTRQLNHHNPFFHPWPLGTCSSVTTRKNIVKWLKKYIKLLKVDKLMFLAYDAELDPNNFMRCPEARTCGPTLRLPNNYRTCTMPFVFIQDLNTLPQIFRILHKELAAEYFTVNTQGNAFSKIALDQAQEHNNEKIKSTAGIKERGRAAR